MALLIFGCFLLSIQAKELSPTFRLHATGVVSDFVVDSDRLYAATDMGTVDIFDLNTQKIIEQIIIAPLKTARNEIIPARIHSVDVLNGKVLILSSGKNTFRNVWMYENHSLKQIVDESKELFIKEARFINDERVMFGTFASEMILYDTTESYQVYKRHMTQSTLGDITLGAYKKMIMSDESGEIRVFDIENSEIEEVYSGQNLDNVYKVAYANGVIITAGQDRRVGVYQKDLEAYYIKSDFLVYCVGISPSGTMGVYSSGINSDLQVFNTKTKAKGDLLIGHFATVNAIKFINEKEFFSSGEEKDIFFWKLH
ncbi:MAG: nitrate reductase [Campylobacterota bacterium]|nr:nitrate reductase [Campylobacterota bacterium]